MNDRKRVIIFVGSMGKGGAQRVISILSAGLVNKGYEVEILSYRNTPSEYKIDERVQMTSVSQVGGNLLHRLIWLRKHFRDKADVIISFLAPFNMLALAAHMGLNIPIIVADRNDPHFIPENKLARFARDILYYFADGIVVQTSQNKAYFSNALQKKCVVIANPIELGEKKGLALRTAKKKKIVSVGRLMPQKNQKMLLDAFAAVHKKNPEYELYIYGDGPMRKELNEYAVSLGVKDNVHLPGNVSNVFECISDAELFVLSSYYEGMPNALIEAMCLGLPCITTRVSGAEDLIQDGVSGEIIDVGNTDMLKEKMTIMLNAEDLRNAQAFKAVKVNEMLESSRIIDCWVDYVKGMT